MRNRQGLASLAVASVLFSVLNAFPAVAAPPKVVLSLKQSGTSVSVSWKYNGSSPASQTLVVTPVEEVALAPDTTSLTDGSTTGETVVDPLESFFDEIDEVRTITLKKTARSAKVNDLLPGKSYTFTLTSKKPTLKASKKFTVLAKPEKPTNLQLIWDGKDLKGVWDYIPKVSEYVVTYTPSGGEAKTLRTGSDEESFTIPKLDKSLGYTVTVQATNAAGKGSKASATILQAAPNRPSNLLVRPLSANGESISLSWEYAGPALTGIRVQINGAGFSRDLDVIRLSAEARSTDITGLTSGGTYSFAVTAVNNESTAMSKTDPYQVSKVTAAPTGLSTTPGNSSVALKWNAPAGDSANPVTGYRVDFSENGTEWRSAVGEGTATAYTIQNLTNGISYSFRVLALTAKGPGLTSSVVSAAAGQAPTAPTNVKVVAALRQVVVTWSAPTVGGPITEYRVEYKTASATNWSSIDSVAGNTTTINGLEPGITYGVRVSANGESGWSPASVVVTGTPTDVPGSVTITATRGVRKVDLRWTAAASNGASVQGYKVDQQVNDGVWVPVQTPLVLTTALTVNNLTPGQTYRFKVIAVNAAGSGPESVSSAIAMVAAPDAPTLIGTAAASQVALSWVAPASNGEAVTAYKLERSIAGASWSIVSESIPGTTLTYTVTGLLNGTKYGFRVSAKNATGWSLPSTVVEATPVTVPSAPTYLSAIATVKAIRAVWQPIPSNAAATGGSPITGYIVSYRAVGGEWTNSPIGPTRESVTEQTLSDLTPGVIYEVRVAAINAVGESLFSPVRRATPYALPGAVNNLSAVGKDKSIVLTWTKPVSQTTLSATVILRYRVEYSTDGLNWDELELLQDTEATLEALRNGVPYDVRVTSAYVIEGTVYDGESVIVRATPRGVPDAPQNIRVEQIADVITVNWDAPANNGGAPLEGYIISFSADGTEWIGELSTQATTRSFPNLIPGIPYTFRLQSTNRFGSSLYGTVEFTAKKLPAAVKGLTVKRAYNSEVSLAWYASPSAEEVTGYRVEKSNDGQTWTTAYTNTDKTTVVVGGLTNGQTYQFRVSAINVAGYGSSVSVSALPVGPTSVVDLSATAGDSSVTLRWVSPTSGGVGISITGIQVKYQQGQNPVVILPTLAANASTFVVEGLTNGQLYQFWVTAKTSSGDSTSQTAMATPTNLIPDPVTNLVTSDLTSTSVNLTWDEPVLTGLGSITYKVEYRRTGSTWIDATSSLTDTTYALTGLTANAGYEVRVSVLNGIGPSSYTVVEFTTTA